MIRTSYWIWLSFFCLLFSQEVKSQTTNFESKELQQAASLLSEEIPYAEILYAFAENYLNQLLALTSKERNWRMQSDDVKIEEGGLDRLHLVNKETSLSMRAKENRYTFSLANGDFKIIQFSCPMSYQLITQKKLKELESEYMAELSSFHVSDKKRRKINKSELTKTAPHLYIEKGTEYFLEAINNDLYYIEEKKEFALVYDPAYIAESICNMLLSEDTPCDILLKLSIRQYGFKTDELKIPLKQWIAYCRNKGCNLYVGIESLETNQLKACVFAVNEHFKYNHVMNTKVPYSLLDKPAGEIEGDITIFIPTHNLQALFEEFNLTNN